MGIRLETLEGEVLPRTSSSGLILPCVPPSCGFFFDPRIATQLSSAASPRTNAAGAGNLSIPGTGFAVGASLSCIYASRDGLYTVQSTGVSESSTIAQCRAPEWARPGESGVTVTLAYGATAVGGEWKTDVFARVISASPTRGYASGATLITVKGGGFDPAKQYRWRPLIRLICPIILNPKP